MKRVLLWVMLLTFSAGLAVQEAWATPISERYYWGDIEVIHRIIENNGLAWSKMEPTGKGSPWGEPHVHWSSWETPRRITELWLMDMSLYGYLDLRGLDRLEILSVDYNQLTGLNVSDSLWLDALSARDNRLTALDVSHIWFLWILLVQDNHMSQPSDVVGWENAGLCGFWPQNPPVYLGDFHWGDIEVVHAMIANNGLDWPVLDLSYTQIPREWRHGVRWSAETPRRITELRLSNQRLEGNLNVSGLDALQSLDVRQNHIWHPDDVIGWEASGLVLGDSFLFWPQIRRVFETYYWGDIEAIHAMIANNGLNLMPALKGETALPWSWVGRVAWSEETPRRITHLSLNHQRLAGHLNLSGLEALEWLDVRNNYLYCAADVIGWEEAGLVQGESFLFWPQRPRVPDLYWGDIAVINAIIASNGLAWPTVHPTDTWLPLEWLPVFWSAESPGRVTQLFVANQQLTGKLDLSGLEQLRWLSASNNRLTSLDVSNNPALDVLSVLNNQLTALDLSGNPALTELSAELNHLTTLDLSGNPALLWISVRHNHMQSPADVIGWEALGLTLDNTFQFWPQTLRGDVDGNGIVDLCDVSLLARYLAGHDVRLPNRWGATVTPQTRAQGFPDLRDVLRLRRYLAGHDVTLY